MILGMLSLRKKSGYSLVEILVCLTLIGLIVITVFPTLTFGYLQLSESGKRTKAVYSVRQAVENELVNQGVPASDTVTVTFGSVSLDIKGRIVETEESFGTLGSKARIRIFIPEK